MSKSAVQTREGIAEVAQARIARVKTSTEKLNFQILRRTMATQAQNMGSVKDIQAHLRHARPDTTANEYMQALPASVQQMVG